MDYRSVRLILISYLVAIAAGTLLLKLPAAHIGELSWVDSLFTATSATCVTGLIVKSTGGDFTFFGQAVIAGLIQLGGFGYMTMATLLVMLLGRRLSFRDRMLLKESYDTPSAAGVFRFLIAVFVMVVLFEALGAALLTVRFMADFPFEKALWLGVFHAVSAFNNAGFSLFNESLMGYRVDLLVNGVVMTLIVVGGIGFLVLVDLYYLRKRAIERLSTHTKVVLWATAFLLAAGAAMVLVFEWHTAATLGGLPFYERVMAALFTSVNYRTSGFNVLDFSAMTDATLFFSTMFMMIGGGPGSTAGGLKVTTFAVLLIALWFSLRGSDSPYVFKRALPRSLVGRAMTVLLVSSFYVSLSAMLLSRMHEELPFVSVLFEVVSGFATVGLSTGDGNVASLSAAFSDPGKLIMVLLMFMGRVGVLAFTLILLGKARHSRIQYPEGRIML